MNGNSSIPRQLRVALIGLGAVGSNLARALAGTPGMHLTLIGLARASERRLADELGVESCSRLDDLPQNIDIIILTVDDRNIRPVAESIAQLIFPWRQISVLHCSGPLGAEELSSLARVGAGIAAWHPYQTFPRRARNIPLAGITFGIDGNPRGLAAARRLTRLLGGHAVRVKAADRVLYHISAVFACGFVATDLVAAMDLLREAGFTDKEARQTMLAIAEQTLANARALGPTDALTGPAARGDDGMVRKHLQELRRRAPQLVEFYREVSRYLSETRVSRK